jgi:hydrogenase maturation protease
VTPLLVLAVGNPSRGDDALGPLLLDRLRAQAPPDADGVDWLEDFQLQVEHALDLRGRRAVLFVDAARPGTVGGVRLSRIGPEAGAGPLSHALRPQAVLGVARQLDGDAPPAWLLAIEGEGFGLGAPPSARALCRLQSAQRCARGWLAAHGVR